MQLVENASQEQFRSANLVNERSQERDPSSRAIRLKKLPKQNSQTPLERRVNGERLHKPRASSNEVDAKNYSPGGKNRKSSVRVSNEDALKTATSRAVNQSTVIKPDKIKLKRTGKKQNQKNLRDQNEDNMVFGPHANVVEHNKVNKKKLTLVLQNLASSRETSISQIANPLF